MAHIVADRVQETTTTTGTGTLTLGGAVTNFRTFSSVMTTSDTCWYAIVDSTNNAWETGLGTLASATTLTRTTVINSSNSNALVSLGTGTKYVFITPIASKSVVLDNVNAVTLPAITDEPSAPPADNLAFYAKKISGKMIPKIKGPSGLDTPLQVALWQNNTTLWTPSSATAGVWQGIVSTTTSAGTFAVATPTNTSLYTSVTRGRYANVVTTLNQILGIRFSANPTFFLGASAGRGGFFFFCRMGFDVWTNGSRMFVGLSNNNAGVTVTLNPSIANNSLGFIVDDSDNGAISFMMRNTATTKTATGFTVVSGKGYDMFMWASPNSTTVNWRIIDINAGTEATGSGSTNAPATNTMMGPNVLASNAALTTATATQIGINRLYIETDY